MDEIFVKKENKQKEMENDSDTIDMSPYLPHQEEYFKNYEWSEIKTFEDFEKFFKNFFIKNESDIFSEKNTLIAMEELFRFVTEHDFAGSEEWSLFETTEETKKYYEEKDEFSKKIGAGLLSIYKELSFEKKRRFILFLKNVNDKGLVFNPDNVSLDNFFEMISESESNDEGSYFLKVISKHKGYKQELEESFSLRKLIFPKQENTFIAPGIWALAVDGKLFINEYKDAENVKKNLQEIKNISLEIEKFNEKSWEIRDRIGEEKRKKVGQKISEENIKLGPVSRYSDKQEYDYNRERIQQIENEIEDSYLEVLEKELFPIKKETTEKWNKYHEKEKEIQKLFKISLIKEFSRFGEDSQLNNSFLMQKNIREVLEKELGFSLSDLTLRHQFYLADFLKTLTNKESDQVFSFFRKNGISSAKTFLSLESGGPDMGRKILELGTILSAETANRIFSKYSEIIDSVEHILDIAQHNFKSTIDTKPELLQSIEQSLYKRGADLLSQFHANINQNPEEIINELERINADTITTLSIFKYAAKFGNKLPLEDISGAEFSKKTGNDFNADEIDEMEHIYQVNWKNYGNQQLIQSVIKKFKESLSGDHSDKEELYLFKKNNQINAFVKFSKLHDGVKYASALNVDQSSKGFGLGEAMMDEALYREAQENILLATCDPFNESNMRYMEKGFVATGFTGDNPPVMNICWNESMNNHIQSKHISHKDLVVMYLKQQVPSNLVIKKAKDLHLLHKDFPIGKSLTRCFRDPLHTGDWYAVYETTPGNYETNIKTAE